MGPTEDPPLNDRAKSLWDTTAFAFATVFLFGFGLAAENLAPGDWPRLLLGQFENLAFSGLLALPLLWLAGSRAGRRLHAVVVAAVLVYMALDQVFYRMFFDHFQIGIIEGQEGGLATLKDSILFELKPVFFANAAVALVLGGVLFRRAGRPQTEQLSPRGKRTLAVALIALSAYGGATWYLGKGAKLSNLNFHPVVSLGRSVAAPVRHEVAKVNLVEDLDSLRFGQPTAPSLPPDTWQPEPGRWLSSSKKPNVVLIVLESVGSEQLLTNGRPSPERTPELARRVAEMTTFPAIYSMFPGTVRSHAPLSTGGRTITWGSVFEELSFTYAGPTIVSELKSQGYAAGLFSAAYMEAENLGGFYDQLPYDVWSYPDRWTPEERKRFEINSWGVDEREVVRRGVAWAKTARAPFFLHLLASSTHHPYSIPADFKAPLPRDEDRKNRYANALAFLDHALGLLFKELAAAGHADDTLIFVVGDHGQAFGDVHPQNLTHKNHIYEENVRNFLMVIDPKTRGGPLAVSRIGSLGDVAPTVLGFVTEQPKDFAGQNLFDPSYEERLVFFHKNALPERWGLRDGRWKFAVDKVGGGNAELFDLDLDGAEQENLAARHPDQVKAYTELVASWYIKTNDAYTSRLKDFRKAGGIQLSPEDVQSFGPKRLVFGTKAKGGKFQELAVIHPEEDMVAWTYGVPFPRNQKVDYEWLSPSGEAHRFYLEFDKDWSQTEVFHSAKQPLEEGIWTLNLAADGQPLLSGTFKVKASAPLVNPRKFP